MPEGCFAILLTTESDFKVLGYYFKDKRLDFEITSDMFLRLSLDHAKNEFSLLKLKNVKIESYIYKFKGKLSRKAYGFIIGLLLNEDDDPEKFRVPLKNSTIALETLNFLEISAEDFQIKLIKTYREFLETLTDVLDATSLKESIINRTKDMLSGDKKERKVAQELLQKIEDNIHIKISEFYKSAEDSLKYMDYERASKQFSKAADVAEELLEIDLAKSLRERAKLSVKIPDLAKKREEIVKDARNALKKEDFYNAYIYYKRASEISKELMQPDQDEEYALKSKALQDFYNADQKFKKKE